MKTHRHGKCGASTRGPIRVMKVCSGWKWKLLPRSEVLMCDASCWPRSFDQQTKSFTEAEEDLIVKLHSLLGNRWGLIAGRLPDRTENEVKTYWNAKLKAKLLKNGNMHTKKKKISLSVTRTLHESQVADATSGIEEHSNVTRGLNLDLSMSLSYSAPLDAREKVQADTVDHSPSLDAGNIDRETLLLFQ